MAPCYVATKPLEEDQFDTNEVATPIRNVVFAVNYEVSMVDQFLAQSKQKRRRRGSVEPVPMSTSNENFSTTNYNENEAPNPVTEDEGTTTSNTGPSTTTTTTQAPDAAPADAAAPSTAEPKAATEAPTNTTVPPPPLSPTPTLAPPASRRKSARERPRKGQPLARARVRYDMQMVPPATRNPAFLQQFDAWWKQPPPPAVSTATTTAPAAPVVVAPPTRRSSRLCTSSATTTEQPEPEKAAAATTTTTTPATPACTACNTTPFQDDSQVIWIPKKRSEWEDCVSELTAVCTSAAIRRLRAQAAKTGSTPSSTKPFHAPLSRDYIRDRVDIDDPLNGFQLRHRQGGWLQGFVLWTNFTTWTHYFKWDSQHAVSGMAGTANPYCLQLTQELEAQPRSGDPLQGGVVFPTIAEIGLLGGLGCGEYMLRMALESIRRHPAGYRYVVLQATDSSKTFYERFGFVRVGAICRYGKSPKVAAAATAATNAAAATAATDAANQESSSQQQQQQPVQGYRHWTHANESERSLQKHGGPSYMMCLKLPTTPPPEKECCALCGQARTKSFLDQMMDLAVEEKPTIEQLGAATPITKNIARRNSTASLPDMLPSTTIKRGRGRPPKNSTTPRRKSLPGKQPPQHFVPTAAQQRQPTSTRPSLKHSLSLDSRDQPPTKRRRVEKSRNSLLTPPRGGKSLSYAQKQYQSVWLAVPPNADAAKAKPSPRPPPKRRPSLDPSAAGAIHTRSTAPIKKSSSKKPRSSSSSSSSKNPSRNPSRSPRPDLPPPAPLVLARGRPKNPVAIDKAVLYKQKVKAYPRSRIHYFNRVVKAKDGHKDDPYCFVLQYDEPTGLIKIVPMTPKGKLTGKREGRPRYQAVVGDDDSNFRIVKSADYRVVPATMVMKTPVVACEAWDIEDKK